MAMRNFLVLLGSYVLFLAFAATPLASAAPVPLLKIDQPVDGQIIDSYVLDFKFSLKNFSLKDYKNLPKNKPNEGHMHLWLDAENRTQDNARMNFKNDAYTFADVSAGKHSLVVELVNNDHSSFDPQIIQTIKFESKAPVGSEQAPVKPGDAPEVAISKSGEIPLTKSLSSGSNSSTVYVVLGVATALLGFLGIFILKKGSKGDSSGSITPQL